MPDICGDLRSLQRPASTHPSAKEGQQFLAGERVFRRLPIQWSRSPAAAAASNVAQPPGNLARMEVSPRHAPARCTHPKTARPKATRCCRQGRRPRAQRRARQTSPRRKNWRNDNCRRDRRGTCTQEGRANPRYPNRVQCRKVRLRGWDREADRIARARKGEWSGVASTTRMVEGSMRKSSANEANISPAKHNCMTVGFNPPPRYFASWPDLCKTLVLHRDLAMHRLRHVRATRALYCHGSASRAESNVPTCPECCSEVPLSMIQHLAVSFSAALGVPDAAAGIAYGAGKLASWPLMVRMRG